MTKKNYEPKGTAMKTKVINPKSLGHILKSARISKGLSQSEAGKAVGVDQPTLSNIERGETHVRIDTLFRILAALDLEIVVQSREMKSDLNEGNNW